MNYFLENFNYILGEISRINGRKMAVQEYADFLKINRLSILKYIAGEYTPKVTSLQHIAAMLKHHWKWNIVGADLMSKKISELYSVDEKVDKRKRTEFVVRQANIEDVVAIGKRLKELRKGFKMSLMSASRKTKEWFPNQKEYQISNTHIMQIERGLVPNINVHKVRALSTIYRTPVEYILFGWKEITGVTVDRGQNVILIPMSEKLAAKDDKMLTEIAQRAKDIIEMFE